MDSPLEVIFLSRSLLEYCLDTISAHRVRNGHSARGLFYHRQAFRLIRCGYKNGESNNSSH